MSERFGPNTFERLAQGSEARRAHIEAGRDVLTPVEIPASKVRSYERAAGFAAVPLLLVMVATACGGGGNGNGERQKDGTGEFGQNLPPELFESCRLFVESDLVGGPLDQEGFNIAFGYLQDNIIDSDPRTTYMAAAGELFNGNYDFAQEGFDLSIDEGLPKEQAEIAQDVIDSIDNLRGSGDVETVGPLFEAMADVRSDMENNICPNGEPIEIGEEEYSGESVLKNLFDCAVDGDVSCQNELISKREAIPLILREVLSNEIEHEYIPGAFTAIIDVLPVSVNMLLRINGGDPDSVEVAVSKVVEVLECSTHSSCGQVDIGGESILIESGDIDMPIGLNALNFIKSVAYIYPPQEGVDLVAPHIDRLRSVQEWVEQRVSPTNSEYAIISGQLKEVIFYLEEQLEFRE